jgi:hypothetical protein
MSYLFVLNEVKMRLESDNREIALFTLHRRVFVLFCFFITCEQKVLENAINLIFLNSQLPYYKPPQVSKVSSLWCCAEKWVREVGKIDS